MFPSHPVVSTPHSSCHTSPHWLCHTHPLPGTVRNRVCPGSYSIFSVTTQQSGTGSIQVHIQFSQLLPNSQEQGLSRFIFNFLSYYPTTIYSQTCWNCFAKTSLQCCQCYECHHYFHQYWILSRKGAPLEPHKLKYWFIYKHFAFGISLLIKWSLNLLFANQLH